MKYILLAVMISTVLFQYTCTSAILNENERVHEHKLSDQEHYTDLNNDNKLEHNAEYDHEAFLGKDEAKSFKKLTPEESRKKLGEIVDKIDADKDGFVTETELQNWIRNVSKLYLLKDVESRWKAYDPNNTGSFSLQTMLDVNYGALEFWTEEEKEKKKDEYKAYKKLIEREKIRFNIADADGDGKLNKSEYSDFLHPEEVPRMRDIVVSETLSDLDKNEDGVVDIDEYLADIYPEKQEVEPEWVQTERQNFATYRDFNSDGKLDLDEIKAWILPADYDHTNAEAKHLISEADADKDEKLTKEEILEKYHVFVASQATAYGDTTIHEDL